MVGVGVPFMTLEDCSWRRWGTAVRAGDFELMAEEEKYEENKGEG